VSSTTDGWFVEVLVAGEGVQAKPSIPATTSARESLERHLIYRGEQSLSRETSRRQASAGDSRTPLRESRPAACAERLPEGGGTVFHEAPDDIGALASGGRIDGLKDDELKATRRGVRTILPSHDGHLGDTEEARQGGPRQPEPFTELRDLLGSHNGSRYNSEMGGG
jgi:hypothetical protein